jgi:methyl-accepting chemotaxis protein
MKKGTSLERKMLTYFGLIAAASLLITVEFIYAIQSAIPLAESSISAEYEAISTGSGVTAALKSLEGKAMLMFVVQAVVTLIVLIMFMRRITSPLQHMVEASSKIMEGDLSRTINIRSRDEIGLLGETINGLTSNIQELVAYCGSVTNSLKQDLSFLEMNMGRDSQIKESLKTMEDKLDGIEAIMDEFTLLAPPGPDTAQGGDNKDAS